ncbi:MAG: LytR family transcriptional regulator, partial [Leucobacter sp.]|nr:LytR family transcriptional regulator [Leucobacter sp.]
MSGALDFDLERPIRTPDLSSPPLMTKRARWLVVLGFLLPGSAQLLAGNRKLGRFGTGVTIATVVVAVIALLGLLFARATTLSLLTNNLFLFVLQWLVAALGLMWLVLGIDTLRLTKLVRVIPNWRVPIAMLSVILTLVPVAGAAWASSLIGTGRGAIGSIFIGAPAVKPIDGRYNILLLGTDAGSDREGIRPDSISLVSVDAKTGQSVIIGLPRELIEMPFPEESPMSALHPYGFGVGPNVFGEWGGCYTTCYLNAVYTEVEDFPDTYAGLYPDAVSRGSEPG